MIKSSEGIQSEFEHIYLFVEEIQLAFVAEDACEVLTVRPSKGRHKRNQKQTQNSSFRTGHRALSTGVVARGGDTLVVHR